MALPVEVNPLFLENQYAIQRSLRLRQGNSNNAYLNRTPASSGNRKTWTWSAWLKRGTLGANQILFDCDNGTTDATFGSIGFLSGDTLAFGAYNQAWRITTQVFRDPSAFYHFVVAFDTTQATPINRVKIYVNGVQIFNFGTSNDPTQNTDYAINQNAVHNIAKTYGAYGYFDGYLAEVNFIDTPIMVGSTNSTTTITLTSGTTSGLQVGWNVGGTNIPAGATISSITDSTHFVISSAATGTGSSISFGATPPLSAFGQYNEFGVWSPRKYGGSYGTNGFYLPFNDPTSATTLCYDRQLGYTDTSKNNWTPNNISTTPGPTYDAMTDVPPPSTIQNVAAGNYAVISPLDISASNSQRPTDGNLTYPVTGAFQYSARGTIFVTSGKWYAEFTMSSSAAIVAVVNSSAILSGYNAVNGIFTSTTSIYNNGTQVQSGLAAFSANDVIGVAFDADANTVQFYRNGSTYGTAVTISAFSGPFTFQTGANGATCTINANFGQQPFRGMYVSGSGSSFVGTGAPPSGFRPLNTNNLPSPTIPNGARVMAAVTWNGDNASPRSLVPSSTNSGNNPLGTTFQPDFVWVKNRTSGLYWNVLFDSVRGAGNQLSSNQTDAELASASNIAGKVSAFNADGFSVLSGSSGILSVNGTSNSYVGWQWKAGGSTPTTGTGTGGITNVQYSANVSAGFSIVTYTGSGANGTVTHGLGATPAFIMIKDRGSSSNGGVVYHTSLGATQYLQLFITTTGSNGYASDNTMFNGGSPTFNSSVFSVGTNVRTNTTDNYIAYCWAPVSGYSAMGSYTANASTDGPMVFLNFRPRFILLKNTTRVLDWIIYDSSRDLYNTETQQLYPNLSSSEASGANIDFLSNGFKIRAGSGSGINNTSGDVYIYAAFAENPFRMALAR